MAYNVKLQQFEGPLDLLLEIVEAKKFNILNLSLSELAEQFLSYLSSVPEKNISEIAGFIAVGARLALLKSRELVPTLFEEEDEDSQSLQRQLAIYHPYRSAAKKLERITRSKKRFFSRDAFASHEPVFTFPSNLSRQDLFENIRIVLGSIEHARNIPQAHIKETISLQECVDHLMQVIKTGEKLDFTLYLKGKKSDDHVIHFIGLLELVRAGHVEARQRTSFGAIEIMTYAAK